MDFRSLNLVNECPVCYEQIDESFIRRQRIDECYISRQVLNLDLDGGNRFGLQFRRGDRPCGYGAFGERRCKDSDRRGWNAFCPVDDAAYPVPVGFGDRIGRSAVQGEIRILIGVSGHFGNECPRPIHGIGAIDSMGDRSREVCLPRPYEVRGHEHALRKQHGYIGRRGAATLVIS